MASQRELYLPWGTVWVIYTGSSRQFRVKAIRIPINPASGLEPVAGVVNSGLKVTLSVGHWHDQGGDGGYSS